MKLMIGKQHKNMKLNKRWPMTKILATRHCTKAQLYALYIGPNDSNTGHFVFKLSTKQILTTPKCKFVPMPKDIIQAVNEMSAITNKIQLNHFNRDQHTV